MAKKKVLKSDDPHASVPASKRGKPLTKNHEIYMNDDTIQAEPTSGLVSLRRKPGTNSTKTKE